MPAVSIYNADGWVSGVSPLSAYDTMILSHGDRCWVDVMTGAQAGLYRYYFDEFSESATTAPESIRPDNYAERGRGVWLRSDSPIDPSTLVTDPLLLFRSGMVMAWPYPTPPTGWLECNGAAISRTSYAGLFSAIANFYGNGNGTTTFNIPDYRGEFLRGWSHATGRDPDATTRTDRGDGIAGDAVGTKQGFATQRHNHAYYTSDVAGGAAGSAVYIGHNSATTGFNTGSSSDYETRPRNVNVMWIIKY
jgi:microcystin-dependent protein